MIYNHGVTKPFDDRFVRAADQVFDSLYQSERPERYEEHGDLVLHRHVLEHNSSLLQFPRQVGKTTYLKKLVEALVRTNKNVLVAVPHVRMKKHHRRVEHNFHVEVVNTIGLGNTFRGTNMKFDFIISDEVTYEEISTFLYEIEWLLQSNTIVFGLYT